MIAPVGISVAGYGYFDLNRQDVQLATVQDIESVVCSAIKKYSEQNQAKKGLYRILLSQAYKQACSICDSIVGNALLHPEKALVLLNSCPEILSRAIPNQYLMENSDRNRDTSSGIDDDNVDDDVESIENTDANAVSMLDIIKHNVALDIKRQKGFFNAVQQYSSDSYSGYSDAEACLAIENSRLATDKFYNMVEGKNLLDSTSREGKVLKRLLENKHNTENIPTDYKDIDSYIKNHVSKTNDMINVLACIRNDDTARKPSEKGNPTLVEKNSCYKDLLKANRALWEAKNWLGLEYAYWSNVFPIMDTDRAQSLLKALQAQEPDSIQPPEQKAYAQLK